MDPLSIAASIAGLLTLSAAISTQLGKIRSGPKSLQDLINEISELRRVIISISAIVDYFAFLPPSRRGLVQQDDLVMTLTQAVMTFDDVKGFVDRWPSQTGYSPWQRLQLAFLENRLKDMVNKLQRIKSSLHLLLSIFQCHSDIEAHKSQQELRQIVDQMFREASTIRVPSEITEPDMASCAASRVETEAVENHPIAGSGPGNNAFMVGNSLVSSRPPTLGLPRHAFERILEATFVYSKVRPDNATDLSFTTRSMRSSAWARLAGRSLRDVSIVSVIALPITRNDIRTGSWYRKQFLPSEPSLLSVVDEVCQDLVPRNTPIYKVVLLGDGSVGKTTLAERKFGVRGAASIGSGFCTIQDQLSLQVSVGKEHCDMRLIDTSGQDDYKVLVADAIKESDGFLVVYAINSLLSFQRASTLCDEIRSAKDWHRKIGFTPIVVMGNKSDRYEDRQVPAEHGQALAKKINGTFTECSGLTGENLDTPFENVVRRIRMWRFSM